MEVKELLEIAMNDKIIHKKSVNRLLEKKWFDSLLSKIKGDPQWGYEELKLFFIDHRIEGSDSIKEALDKLKKPSHPQSLWNKGALLYRGKPYIHALRVKQPGHMKVRAVLRHSLNFEYVPMTVCRFSVGGLFTSAHLLQSDKERS